MSSPRDHYFPNTEPLAPNEMRIIALGTGRPFVRRAQANCSWLIELGNSDKFIMDFGSGSQVNFTALEIPYQDVTAIFATHCTPTMSATSGKSGSGVGPAAG